MSARNRPREKKIRALRRALRKGRLPAKIDLVHWLKLHGHAQTSGEARRLLLSGRVKSESHPLGVRIVDIFNDDGKLDHKQKVLDQFVPAKLRSTIRVESA